MEREFVEADVAAIRAEGVRIRTEGENAGAVVELDVADFEVFGEAGVLAVLKDGDFPVFDAMGEDRFGVVEELAELVAGIHIFDRSRLVFAGKEIVAARVAQSLANILKGVGESPTDADGFFGEAQRGIIEDPAELVGEKDATGFGVRDFDVGQDHKSFGEQDFT